MANTTWREQIADEMERQGDPGPVVAVAPSDYVLRMPFNNGSGGSEGPHFLAWTAERVYFPVVYDGAERAGSAPRDPRAEGQGHVGGE